MRGFILPLTKYYSSVQSRMRWAGNVACKEEYRNSYRVLVVTFSDKKPPGRPRHRCDDIIKVNLKVTGWDSMNWIHLVYDRNEWQACVNMDESSGSTKCREFLE
jgi:hypothetical protein